MFFIPIQGLSGVRILNIAPVQSTLRRSALFCLALIGVALLGVVMWGGFYSHESCCDRHGWNLPIGLFFTRCAVQHIGLLKENIEGSVPISRVSVFTGESPNLLADVAAKHKSRVHQLDSIGAFLKAKVKNRVFVKLDIRYTDYFP